MMDWLKEWWHVVAGFAGVGYWLARMESAQRHHKEQHSTSPRCVTRGECDQYRESFDKSTGLQFGHGAAQFAELKRAIDKIETTAQRTEEASQRRHDQLVEMILQQQREHK